MNTDLITITPALFVTETRGKGEQTARIGSIDRTEILTNKVSVEYSLYEAIPAISNSSLEELATELDIDSWEFTRTHWAIKNRDLFKILLGPKGITHLSSKVFTIGSAAVERDLISVMMPFSPMFNDVYSTIKSTAETMNMRCLRADDIWDSDAIIQDVVSLINKSSIIVCDCTQRNANVFYEAGIAHTLGRNVILITQSEADIPFDLRHLRFVSYLNNNEGRGQLAERLRQRIQALIS